MHLTRRDFMKSTALITAGGMAPQFLSLTAQAANQVIGGFKDDRVLVVIQLAGGNDGLNTVVPYEDDLYHNARPQLRLGEDRLIKLGDNLALNNSLKGLADLYNDGQLALIQGVGYPNPDRSHFRSTEIWHTASDSDAFYGRGWIGRYFDNNCDGTAKPQVGLAVDKERPQAFTGEQGFGVSTTNPVNFGWNAGAGAASEDTFANLNDAGNTEGNDSLDFLRHTTAQAMASSAEVRSASEKGMVEEVVKRGRTGNPLAMQMSAIAGLIRGGLDTRIYYASTSGFDTHAGQLNNHDRLLGNFSEAMAGFQKQLKEDGTADRVVTMVFSEFGRRVKQNASGGTDHGTAAPMFLLGDNVNAGLYGEAPRLDDLDQGDLKYNTDFRSVYASVLEDWLGAKSTPVLKGQFDTLPLIG